MPEHWISVFTNKPEQVKAYLYRDTFIHSQGELNNQLRSYFILRVDGSQNMAQYQADRLSSGLHGARVHDTLHKAVFHVFDLTEN